jgi:hypothetical protein
MIEFKPRYFILPGIALTLLAVLHAPADGGRAAHVCGLDSADPVIRASFAQFQRTQSRAAAKACAWAANTLSAH